MPEGQYIYCIVGTGEARNFGPIGIGDRGDPVTTIAYRDLGAVVSSIPMTKYVVSKENMISHEKVIEAVMKDHTLLPVRFYTVAPNAEEIRSLLRRRYMEFKKLLRELDNKVELGLKAVWRDMDAILQEIMNENAEIKVLGTKTTGCSAKEAGQDKGAISEMLKQALEHKKAKEREVIMKAIATPAVTLLRKGTAPLLPNSVWLLPPKAAPKSDPLPDCKSMPIIKPTQITT